MVKVVSARDIKKILAYAKTYNNDYKILGPVIVMYTGLVLSEICALKWEDIDLPNKVIYVKNMVTRVPDTSELKRKTKLEIFEIDVRRIPINHQLVSVLALYSKDVSKCNYVLSNSMGIVDPRSLQNYLKSQMFIEANGFKKGYTLSELRDTFIVVSLKKGVSILTLSEILGVTVTMLYEKYKDFINMPSAEYEMEKLIY